MRVWYKASQISDVDDENYNLLIDGLEELIENDSGASISSDDDAK
jgi:hypothetical protein